LQEGKASLQQGSRTHEAVVGDLGGQASLAVEKKRQAQQFFQDGTDEGALVDVGMDQLGFEAPRDAQGLQEQHQVEVGLVPGGTGFELPVPGNAGDALDRKAGHVAPDVVGDQAQLDAQGEDGAGLLKD